MCARKRNGNKRKEGKIMRLKRKKSELGGAAADDGSGAIPAKQQRYRVDSITRSLLTPIVRMHVSSKRCRSGRRPGDYLENKIHDLKIRTF